MKNIKSKIISALTLAGVIASAIVPVGSVSALDETWGPKDRARYTWESPASEVTFNSITDNPFIGDESNFVRVVEYVEGGNAPHVDNVTVQPGKEYEVWIYFHNNAGANYNDSGKGLARNTRVATSFPTKLEPGDSGIVRGSVSATNANPQAVWDTAFLNADETVWLNYVPNTAVLHTSDKCKAANGIVLSADALFVDYTEVGTGTEAGAMITCYDAGEFKPDGLWGVIPGCNEYAGYVTYRVKAEKPGFWMEKTVAPAGTGNYVEYLTANAGDTLDFKIYYKNTGTTKQTTVMVRDVMPDKMTLVSGSVVATTPEAPNGVILNAENEAELFSEAGLNIGNYEPGQTAVITYQTKIRDASGFNCGENTFTNDVVLETENGTEYDRVRVVVNKICSSPTELPKTGPTEIALLVIIIITIGGGGFYLYKSSRMLKKATAGGAPAPEMPEHKVEVQPEPEMKAPESQAEEVKPEPVAESEQVAEPKPIVETSASADVKSESDSSQTVIDGIQNV